MPQIDPTCSDCQPPNLLSALDIYSASDYLPVALTDPQFGPSYKVEETAFNLAVGTELPRWGWLEARVPASQLKRVNSRGYPRAESDGNRRNGVDDAADKSGDLVQRPELEVFGRAMVAGGKVFGAAHVVDYPWGELGEATFVDVGGGIGMNSILTRRKTRPTRSCLTVQQAGSLCSLRSCTRS